MGLEGKPITIGEKVCPGDPEPRTFLVPPKIRMGTLRRASEIINEIASIDAIAPAERSVEQTNQWFDAHLRAIVEVLSRNYPDLRAADLEDLVDCDEAATLFRRVLELAGKKADEGEAVSP